MIRTQMGWDDDVPTWEPPPCACRCVCEAEGWPSLTQLFVPSQDLEDLGQAPRGLGSL